MRTLTADDLHRANVPERYWTASFKQVPPSAPYRATFAKYVRNLDEHLAAGEGLYLWSALNGTGKTALAAIALRHALGLGHTGYFIRSQAAKEAMQVPERKMFDEVTTVDERMRAVTLLVLDDFAKEHRTASGFAEAALEDLIRERVQRKKTTIITANVGPHKLAPKVPGEVGLFTVDLAEVLKESVAPIEIVGEAEGGVNWRAALGRDLKDRVLGV